MVLADAEETMSRAPRPVKAHLSQIETSLAQSLSSNLLPFMQQLSKAFDLSQFLADMCGTQWLHACAGLVET